MDIFRWTFSFERKVGGGGMVGGGGAVRREGI